jgi:dTDP-4-amino-4,6-dideoxygalactose transaminase
MIKIPFHRPVMPQEIDSIFIDSLKNGWLTTGPIVKDFEHSLSVYTGKKNVVCVNSCTAALHLALASKKFNSGSKFIAPTYTFVASVEVGEYLGMEPILVDSDDNYNINLNQVEDIIKKDSNVKAFIPVHFAGLPVNIEQIVPILDKFNVFLLEDSAHALESNRYEARTQFYPNSAVAFSFYANKNITTAGEGGALATDDKKLAKIARQLSLHGMSKDGWNRFKTGANWEYDVSELGFKYNLTDFAASFGDWQLKQIGIWYKKRKKIYDEYNKAFSKIPGLICPVDSRKIKNHSYHLYIIRLRLKMWKINRNELINKINSSGIGTSVHYKPVHMHSYYIKRYNHESYDFPKSENFFNSVISLPLYPDLNEEEVDYVISTICDLWIKNES